MICKILLKAILQPLRLAKCPERGLKFAAEIYMQKKIDITSPML